MTRFQIRRRTKKALLMAETFRFSCIKRGLTLLRNIGFVPDVPYLSTEELLDHPIRTTIALSVDTLIRMDQREAAEANLSLSMSRIVGFNNAMVRESIDAAEGDEYVKTSMRAGTYW